MLIPGRLEEKLEEDKSLRSSIDAAVADFEPWLKESKLPFFPDYTDHGTGHVEGVLITASSLIGDEAWAGVTAADAAVLILAALLHDCAMHLTEEGFDALVSGASHTLRIAGFGDVNWPELWQEFLFSAKRFDDRALVELFGSPIAVRKPPADKGEMTFNDRLLIGEFVRRHHPRLAHEIAMRGVPGPTNDPIRLSDRLDPKLADIAGLVARSHGLPLRSTFDYLNKLYHRREYKGVHAVFLMAVLRVADYLQIQAERAPKQMLQVKNIRSPVSRREWRAHLSVDNIVPYEDDPEAILVQATPQDVRTYLRLKSWLAGIQEELDTSWAVLGEVYGPAEKLRRLGIVIRRIRSNLDDERAFAQLVEYVPRRVEFDIARSEILKLLIRPLYGDKPEVGIRELLQNSVDAVRELWDLRERNPALNTANLIEQEADVVMWLDEPDETGRASFTISDRGVGMTEEVITDYFLKVGASYRHSDAWAKQHERTAEDDDADLEGDDEGDDGRPAEAEPDSDVTQDPAAPLKSRVLRSGRFGVGALAAFLLGDEIEVSTRHVTADKGIRFTTRLESEAIELRFEDSLKIGTTIRTTISEEVYEELAYLHGKSSSPSQWEREHYIKQEKWDWYCLGKPSVLRLFGREQKKLPQELTLPDVGDELPPGWYEVDDSAYKAIYCTFSESGLICNGLQIKGHNNDRFKITEHFFSEGGTTSVRSPLVSVFDPDGKLPLNLTRDALILDDFVENIYDVKMRYALAHLILNTPSDETHIGKPELWIVSSNILSIAEKGSFWPWLYTASGLAVSELPNILNNRVRCGLILITFNWKRPLFIPSRNTHDATFLLNHFTYSGWPDAAKVFASLISGFDSLESFYGPYLPQGKSARVLTTKEYGLATLKRYAALGTLKVREEWSNDKWMLLTKGNPPRTRFNPDFLERAPVPKVPTGVVPMAAEWFLAGKQEDVQPSGLAYYWKEIIREPVIPYDLEERRAKLAHAYEILAPYIEKIEKDARVEAARKKAPPRRGGGRAKKR